MKKKYFKKKNAILLYLHVIYTLIERQCMFSISKIKALVIVFGHALNAPASFVISVMMFTPGYTGLDYRILGHFIYIP